MHARIAAASLTLVFASHIATAQSVGQMLGRDIRNSAGDAWDVITSPVRGRPSDYLLAGGAFALTAALMPIDDDVDRFIVAHRDSPVWAPFKPFREGGVAFSGRTIAPVAAGALVLGLATKNQRLQEGIFGCLTAYAVSSAIRTYAVYPLIARTRPDSSRDGFDAPPAASGDQYHISIPGSRQWGEHSAPGGHMTNIAACASFLSHRFSMGAAEPIVYGLAVAVGVSRMLDRRHWLSDNVIGLIYGFAVGKEIALRSGRRVR